MAVPVGCIQNGNVINDLQVIFYFAASVLGFFVTIPLGIVQRNFQGSCILFAQIVHWERWIIWPWSETSCDFVLYMNLAINIFYATFMGAMSLFMKLRRSKSDPRRIGPLDDWHISFVLTGLNPIFLFVNSLVVVMEVSGASIITAGFSTFCNFTLGYAQSLPSSVNGTQMYIPSTCAGLDSRWNYRWDHLPIVRGTGLGVAGYNFFGCLIVATIASWLLMFVWIAHLSLNVGMSCRTCSCEIAEEKRKPDQSMKVAQRRSRLATPIATPGGYITPGSAGRHTPGGPMPDSSGQHRMMMPMGVGGPPQQMSGPPSRDPGRGNVYSDVPPYSPSSPTSQLSSDSMEKKPLPSDDEGDFPAPPEPRYEPPPVMRAPQSKQVYKKAPKKSDMI